MSRYQSMHGDVDIMGVKRGAHQDGADICPKFVFKIPGGTNPDGSTLWGWNDAKSASCKNCGRRDLEHVVIRDFTAEALKEEREKAMRKAQPPPPPPPRPISKKAADKTAANPDPSVADPEPGTALHNAKLGMFELEPGIPDPLAMNAYQDAAREHAKVEAEERAARASKVAAEAVAAVTSTSGPMTATGTDEATLDDENERFKAEVEKMVKEQLAKEKLNMLSAPVAGAPESVKEMLGSLGLEQYLQAFEEEEMEMSVLVTLARSEGKDALDEALKEVGVKSIGHRLKIFAALQG